MHEEAGIQTIVDSKVFPESVPVHPLHGPGADLGGGRGGRGPPFRQGTMPPHPPSRARASPSDDCYAVNRPPLFQNPGSAPVDPFELHSYLFIYLNRTMVNRAFVESAGRKCVKE